MRWGAQANNRNKEKRKGGLHFGGKLPHTEQQTDMTQIYTVLFKNKTISTLQWSYGTTTKLSFITDGK